MAKKIIAELDKEALFRQLGYEPHEGQLLVHRSKAKRRVLCTGSMWGKSVCAAMEAVAAALEPRRRSMGWCVGPTLELADKVFREIVIVVAEHLKHRLVELRQHEKKIVLRNLGGGLSEIRGKTADNPVSLLGEGLDWLIVDEAARMKPAVWHSFLAQRLLDQDGWALLISTPKGKGWLWEMWKRGQPGGDPDYESWNAPSWQNPYLKHEVIEAERERLPEAVFAQEIEGRFMEGAGQVFRYVRESATAELQEPVRGEQYFAGLDLAKVADYSVLTIMNKSREVVHVDRFNKLDWGLQVARVKATGSSPSRSSTRARARGPEVGQERERLGRTDGDPLAPKASADRHVGRLREPAPLHPRARRDPRVRRPRRHAGRAALRRAQPRVRAGGPAGPEPGYAQAHRPLVPLHLTRRGLYRISLPRPRGRALVRPVAGAPLPGKRRVGLPHTPDLAQA